MMVSAAGASPTARGGNPLGRWFDNRKVRSKILIAVGAVALAGAGSAFIGVSELDTLNRAGTKIVTSNLLPGATLADARIELTEP